MSQAKGLLSYRAAARLLGVDRNTTLPDMVKRGEIKVMQVNGMPRIPLAEIVRLLKGEDAWDLRV